MESAFGIDHGYDEIEKISFGGIGAGIGRGFSRAGQSMRRSGAGAIAQGRQAGGGFGQGLQRGGAARVKMGGQLRKLGQGMQNRPGLTGGLAVGGGAAVAGAGAGGLMNRRRF